MFLTSNKKRVLVIGGSSFVGGAYIFRYAGKRNIHYTYWKNAVKFREGLSTQVDLQSEVRLCELFSELRPEVVIHAGAMTHVSECEKDWKMTYDINVKATSEITLLCQNIGARIIYLSTDMVFDGDRGGYEENDRPFPISRYGKSKHLAEDIVYSGVSSPNTVLRLALVYGLGATPHSKGFIGWLKDSLENQSPINLFTDEYRTPIYLEDVIDVIDQLVSQEHRGIFHLGGRERISRYDFGIRFAEVFGYDPECLIASSIKDYQGPKRPADLSLKSDRVERQFTISLSGIAEGLRRMKEIEDGKSSLRNPWLRNSEYPPTPLSESEILG